MTEASHDASENEATDNELNSNPGRILRAAREELDFSINHVAHELHLRSSVVTALEDDRYDEFSSDVFLKGYFRSYCRLVNLHELRMVELLERQLDLRQNDIDKVALGEKKQKQFKKRKKAILIGVSVVVLVGLLVGGIKFYTSNTVPAPDPLLSLPSPESTVQNEGSDVMSPDSDDQAPQEQAPQEQATPEPQAVDVASHEEIPVISNDVIPELQEKENEAEATVENVTTVSSAENESAAETSVFEIRFSGDCWLKVVDGNQKSIFASLKRAGDKVAYSGLAPFKIILGDASKVELSFEGKDIDLSKHTARNGRAQITLRKD